jgi:hypothetical protein
MTAGYSGSPLAKKLGLKDGMRAWWDAMPDSVRAAIETEGLALTLSCEPPIEAAHIFVTDCAVLDCKLRMLLPLIDRDGMIWVSWPKRASKVPTDVTEDVIRALALPLGLVDIKVCGIDENWSGLKLVIRKEIR